MLSLKIENVRAALVTLARREGPETAQRLYELAEVLENMREFAANLEANRALPVSAFEADDLNDLGAAHA